MCIDWKYVEEGLLVFLGMVFMLFVYLIIIGIGVGFIMFCIMKVIVGKVCSVYFLLWVVVFFFVVYFS